MRILPGAGRALIGAVALTIATTALADEDWSQGVIVSADRAPTTENKDDRAIYACAQNMIQQMFPQARRIRVVTNPRDREVFSSAPDSALPGVQMAVLLQATDPDTGKPLGSAECDVSRDAKVKSIKPGVKDLPANGTPP